MTEKQLVDGIAREKGEPDAHWVVGTCTVCGAPLVSNCYYIGGKGYALVNECWESLGSAPSCNYRRWI